MDSFNESKFYGKWGKCNWDFPLKKEMKNYENDLFYI